ncbi:hypothetical protein TBLA_0A00790 [Henningerozyma blattae CBS 6284]|uniref:Uncharacterized protein n=1 Tax=Henningerozyma blattae (strain ATCC 34711 / CBS 6284 / DSM 70876 / NBRC 10599 / NRRL Y-10934 / UCD 77-7) TaxID=1071380 RepID=I2GUS8_HENB6|nr:hypothetical protein TBLA_0A00790 [Tetrapisispora blattae CBS 6284]CCH57880.1 hypothetical protein TBLA_0A00790 [Tetrapisispora blattae CBS 6284]
MLRYHPPNQNQLLFGINLARNAKRLVWYAIREYRQKRTILPTKDKPFSQHRDISQRFYDQFNISSRIDLKKLGFSESNLENNHTTSNDDLLIKYLQFASSKINGTINKRLNKLEHLLNNLEENDNGHKLAVIFDYLLIQCQNEASILNKRIKDKKKSGLNNEIFQEKQNFVSKPATNESDGISENKLEDQILNELFDESSTKDRKYIKLYHTELLFHILEQIKNNTDIITSNYFSLEQIVEVFEFSKLFPIRSIRDKGIFLAGNIVYSSGKVRMDPVNESFYIESLVNSGSYKKAFLLYKTNEKNVNEKWWYEMGMMIALRSNNLLKFKHILDNYDLKYDSYPYMPGNILKLSVQKYLQVRNFSQADKLTARLITLLEMNKHSKKNNTNNLKTINFKDEEEANSYLNKLEYPSNSELLRIIENYLHKRTIPKVDKLMEIYKDLYGEQIEDNDYFMVKKKIQMVKDSTELRDTLRSLKHETSDVKSELRRCKDLLHRMNTISEKSLQNFGNELLLGSLVEMKHAPRLKKSMDTILTKKILEGGTSNNDIPASRKFMYFISILLAFNKENEAFVVVENMEKTNQKLIESSNNANIKCEFPPIQAFHYAKFIDFYTLQLRKIRNKMEVKPLLSKVQNISKRMNNMNIPPNSIYLSKLLKFYEELGDRNICMKITNSILYSTTSEDNHCSSKPFFERRLITRPLFYIIWKIYYDFYRHSTHKMPKVTERNKLTAKEYTHIQREVFRKCDISPIISPRELLRLMVVDSNLLPDIKLYNLIIKVFIKSNDWNGIITVLSLMENFHCQDIDDYILGYILKEIQNQYILLTMYEIKQKQPDLNAKNLITNSKLKVLEMRKESHIFGEYQDINSKFDYILNEICNLLQKKNSKSQPSNLQDILEFYQQFDLPVDKLKDTFNKAFEKSQ